MRILSLSFTHGISKIFFASTNHTCNIYLKQSILYIVELVLKRRCRFMKRYLLIIILIITIAMSNIALFADNAFKVLVNGQEIELISTPVGEDRIIWVPVRSIFESLDSKVEWQGSDNSIFIIKAQKNIRLQINSDIATIDGKEILLDAPVKVANGTSLIPLSSVAKVIPVKVEVDQENYQIKITDFSCGIMLTAKSHILIEPKSGLILLNHNANKKVQAGSVNKIMNLLLIFETLENKKITIDDMVTASKKASSTGGSQIFLQTGEKQSVENLVKSMVMIGANDSAVAIAEHIAGSETDFVALMNQKAESLGLKDTHFLNVTGLDAEGQYTSAYDLAIMARKLIIKHPDVLKFASTNEINIQKPGAKEVSFILSNTNKLLGSYSGSTGLKTAFTANALYCMVGTAERSGLQLTAVVMGASDNAIRYNEATAMFDYGFGCYSVLEYKLSFFQIIDSW